jgi:hypothetical protein
MSVFDRFRRPLEAPWVPPVLGACTCEQHVEQLREHQLPRASDSGDVTVGALLESRSLTVEPITPEPSYVALPVTGQRIGPFHWVLRLEGEGRDLYSLAAPASLDDCLSLQPGVDRVHWPDHEQLLVGAPTLCPSGVMAAMVGALDNPRVRL